MKTFAYAIDLTPDDQLVAEYEAQHRAVWPEVLQGLRDVGVTQMKIFRVGYRMFMYCECEDHFNPATSFPEYLTLHEKIPAWEALMGPMQQVIECAQEGEQWAAMKEVFDFKEQFKGGVS